MDREELNAELLRLLSDVRRVGVQRFLAEVEHLLRRFEPEPERIDGTARPKTIELRINMPRPTISVTYDGIAEGIGTALPARVVTGKASVHGGGVIKARGVVTRPERQPIGLLLALVVLAVSAAVLVYVNTTSPPPEAARANLALLVELLLVYVALRQDDGR